MHAIVGKKYRHYKNGKEYAVLHIGRMESEPETECVIYRAEYDSPDYGSGAIWIRPRAIFEATVAHEGEMVERFMMTSP